MGREKFGEGHYYFGGVANATISEALKPFYSFFRSFACRPAAFCAVSGGQPVLEVGVVCANIDQRLFLVKPYISGFFLLGKPFYHASFLRRCYAIVAFFVCFLRILTWENGDFQTGARRTTPSSYDALHIIIPGVAHIPEEIVLQDAVGFLENGLALCTQDESVNR